MFLRDPWEVLGGSLGGSPTALSFILKASNVFLRGPWGPVGLLERPWSGHGSIKVGVWGPS